MIDAEILNIRISNLSRQELLETLERGVVFTPNVDHLVKLQRDPDFYQIYQEADYRVCDSKMLIYASRFLGMPLKEKISGSDLLPEFCYYHRSNEAIKIFLLGASEGVAHRAQYRINERVGREMVVGCYSPPFGFERHEAECQKIVDMIRRSEATVVAVGLGAPKQEKWIAKYRNQLPNIKIFLAIGAAIDFEAGQKPRSPKWMSEVGLEWLYRLMTEPRRLWRRYLIEDLPFFWWILKQKFNLYRFPHPSELSPKSSGSTQDRQLLKK